ncbi:MAG TPA: DUF3237 domain-containing protein [Polyangiales bacterium]|jgi:hypothetical protein|nr:DUF3237 domain-containing protein [Polyangiales bacterium]
MTDVLNNRLLFELECEIGVPIDAGDPGGGVRRCIPLFGGHFSGDINGELVPGGTDWQTVLPNGTIELSAHYALRTDRGEHIEVQSIGVHHIPPDVMAQLARGERVPPDAYYFRTHMRFRTGAPALARFNPMLAVSMGARRSNRVRLRVFEVL